MRESGFACAKAPKIPSLRPITAAAGIAVNASRPNSRLLSDIGPSSRAIDCSAEDASMTAAHAEHLRRGPARGRLAVYRVSRPEPARHGLGPDARARHARRGAAALHPQLDREKPALREHPQTARHR